MFLLNFIEAVTTFFRRKLIMSVDSGKGKQLCVTLAVYFIHIIQPIGLCPNHQLGMVRRIFVFFVNQTSDRGLIFFDFSSWLSSAICW